MSGSGNYAEECLNIQRPRDFKEISARAKRKESCEAQWECIKNKFLKWRENGAKNIVKLTVNNEIGIARQIQNSDTVLSELLRDGSELITNVRVANDNREVERRLSETKLRTVLLTDLQRESAEATTRLATITERWSELDGFKDPMGLYEGLEYQKRRIGDLMQQKDDIIAELHGAIEKSDVRYAQDQEKQTADTYELVGRIDTQVEVMKRAYRQHLEMLQTTIDGERLLFRMTEAEKWQHTYDDREETEQRNMDATKELSARHNDELRRITIEHEELNRSTKVSLELDNDTLQIELQNVKAEILLNSEKLTYNFRVLKKRADENVIVKSQQKRRLTKLYEIIGSIRAKAQTVKRAGDDEVAKLTQEVMKLHANIMDTDTKATSFAVINDLKYHNVWTVNESEAHQLIMQFLSMDKCIYEQHLGISDWHQSYGEIMSKSDMPSLNSASKSLNVREKKARVTSASSFSSTEHIQQHHHFGMLKAIMEKITTHTQWLQDDDLDRGLLDSFEPTEATLVKITHVFAALGIKNMQDVVELHDHFLPYMFCPNCQVASGSTRSSTTEDEDGSMAASCNDHHYVIESAMVVPTLRAYIEHIFDLSNDGNRTHSSNDGHVTHTRLGNNNDTVSRMLNAADVTQFWNCFAEFVPTQRKTMWTALESGLNRFLNILKKREKLDVECEFLRKQNEELKHLLIRYLPQSDTEGLFVVEETEFFNP